MLATRPETQRWRDPGVPRREPEWAFACYQPRAVQLRVPAAGPIALVFRRTATSRLSSGLTGRSNLEKRPLEDVSATGLNAISGGRPE